jgi:hypothetical protein
LRCASGRCGGPTAPRIAGGLPDSKVGTFTEALMDEAKARSWTVISVKKDWRRIFMFET